MTNTVEIQDIPLKDSPIVTRDCKAPLHDTLLISGPGNQPVLHVVPVT